MICLLLSVLKMPTWHKMVLLISADSSGFPLNAYFHFNGVIYNVKYGVNYVKSCVSLSTSQVSVCTVPSLSSSSKSVLEVGSHLSQVPNSSTFCLSESNAQRSLQSCNPSPIPSCSSRNPSLGCQSIVGFADVCVIVSLLGECKNAIDCRHSHLLWPSLLLSVNVIRSVL